jgi:hypothetical membrane protein
VTGNDCDVDVSAGCYPPVCRAILALQEEALGVQEETGIEPRSECPVKASLWTAEWIIGGLYMKRHSSLSFVTSLAALVCYLTCALLAFLRYPLPYSPLSNWLSDLGNVDVNPGGALFYNIGVVTTGVLLVLFFLGLSQWKLSKNRIQNLMLFLTQGFGILGALALVLSGLYPINHFALHSFFSSCSNILLGTALAFSVAALRYHATCPRWLLILGSVTTLMYLLFGISRIVSSIYVLEWVTIALFISDIALLGVQTQRLSSETRDRSPASVAK